MGPSPSPHLPAASSKETFSPQAPIYRRSNISRSRVTLSEVLGFAAAVLGCSMGVHRRWTSSGIPLVCTIHRLMYSMCVLLVRRQRSLGGCPPWRTVGSLPHPSNEGEKEALLAHPHSQRVPTSSTAGTMTPCIKECPCLVGLPPPRSWKATAHNPRRSQHTPPSAPPPPGLSLDR